MEPRGDAIRNPNGTHPFALMQEEMWGYTGGKLEDSADILNLIKAIPEVEGVLECKKRYWLFDQVVPLMAQFLEENEMLACRLVCKQWCHGVDNYLENSPALRAYEHGKQVTGQIWTWTGPGRFGYRYQGLGYGNCWFASQEEITDFLYRMEGHGRGRNPIMCRSVHVDSDQDLEVLTSASALIERFGHHIWKLSLWDGAHVDPEPFSRSLREWLDLLPNLKSLSLNIQLTVHVPWDQQAFMEMIAACEMQMAAEGADVDNAGLDEGADNLGLEEEEVVVAEADEIADLDGDAENLEEGEMVAEEANEIPDPVEEGENPNQQYLEAWREPLPPLPHLETLELTGGKFPPPIIKDALISSYSRQIRRLHLTFRNWKPELSNAFPNLTELEVHSVPSTSSMKSLLLSIDAPLLYDLYLEFGERACVVDMRTDIFPWLRRFPLIQNLNIPLYSMFANVIGGVESCNPATDSIPSLKHLCIGKCFFPNNSDLLRCFPNLEHLEIQWTIPGEEEERAPLEPSIQIWDAIQRQRMYESNVWEHLPKLRRIQAPPTDAEMEQFDGDDLVFHRERYEYLRTVAAQAND